MSWLGLLLVAVGLYLAYKLIGALVGAYWFAAPHLGWPTVSELVYVMGPDFEGRRIEELADPKALAKQATDRVVDGVVERVLPSSATAPAPSPEDGAAAPAPRRSPEEPTPRPLPEPPPREHDPARVH